VLIIFEMAGDVFISLLGDQQGQLFSAFSGPRPASFPPTPRHARRQRPAFPASRAIKERITARTSLPPTAAPVVPSTPRHARRQRPAFQASRATKDRLTGQSLQQRSAPPPAQQTASSLSRRERGQSIFVMHDHISFVSAIG